MNIEMVNEEVKLRGQGLWVQQTWVWHKPSWRRSPLTHHRAARTNTGLLKGKNKSLCAPGPRRKELWPHRRLTQTCPGVSRSLWWRQGSVVAHSRSGALSAAVGSFEGGIHYLHYLHHSLASGQATGKEHSPGHQQKIGLKIY